MQRTLAITAALAALTPALVAQNAFGYVEADTQMTIGNVLTDGNIPTWVAVSDDNKKMVTGALRTGKVQTITGTNDLTLLNAGRVPFVINETNTGNYWGLNLYGDVVPLKLSSKASTEYFSQDAFGVILGKEAHVFGNWSQQWRKVDLTTTNADFLAGRACLMLRDGRDLYGFSSLFTDQPAKITIPGNSLISPVPGNGEVASRRNFQAYEISATSMAVYSAYRNSWYTLNVGVAITSLTLEYNKNVMLVVAPSTNQVWSYSSLTGVAIPRTFKDVTQVTMSTQDFGITFEETGGDLLYFRAADTNYSILSGRQKDLASPGHHTNNLWAIPLTDSQTNAVDWWASSSSKRRANFVPAGITATETVVASDGNDMTALVVTDRALYGYSAFTNKWTAFKGPKGNYVSSDAEDFCARVTTDTHAYAFNPRNDKWFETTITANASVDDSDQVVAVTETNESKVLCMQSLDWRTQKTQGTLFHRGQGNSYAYRIHDKTGGGSTVYFFQSFADRWISRDLKNRVTDTNLIKELEDGIVIQDGNTVHTFTGFGDLSSNWAAPNDNAAYHAVPGAFARFTAAGPANQPAIFLLGISRQDLAIPGFEGELQVGLGGLLAFPAGAYGPDGVLRFNVTLVGAPPFRYRFQMLGLDLGTPNRFGFGRLLDFEVF